MVVQINIHMRIPEDRRVFIELPAEAPTGDVEMQLTINDRHDVVAIPIPDLTPRRYAKSGLVREIKGSRQ
jgi:hypothetical protein